MEVCTVAASMAGLEAWWTTVTMAVGNSSTWDRRLSGVSVEVILVLMLVMLVLGRISMPMHTENYLHLHLMWSIAIKPSPCTLLLGITTT